MYRDQLGVGGQVLQLPWPPLPWLTCQGTTPLQPLAAPILVPYTPLGPRRAKSHQGLARLLRPGK